MTQANLITLTDPRSQASEAYRTLRTNLMFSGVDTVLKSIVVTSPAPGAGKSSAAANLAVTLAQGGKRTVLVDCDLRRPSQHEVWGINQEPGLTSILLDASIDMPLVAVDIDNLSVLPSGPLPPYPADLLGSNKLDAVVESLAADADYILFDAPPVNAVTDAALLASKLDGTLLVIKAGQTRRDHAERAKEQLERVNARILGALLMNARGGAAASNTYY